MQTKRLKGDCNCRDRAGREVNSLVLVSVFVYRNNRDGFTVLKGLKQQQTAVV